jgi:CheY-like chemotaxis protein
MQWSSLFSRLLRFTGAVWKEEVPDRSAASPETIHIVALGLGDRDRELLARLAAQYSWTLDFGENSKAQILLCDRNLPGADWREVVQTAASAPQLVYSILLSKVADDYLWNEVIRRGGYDLLVTPLREEDVLRAVRLGWSYWSSATKSHFTPAFRR